MTAASRANGLALLSVIGLIAVVWSMTIAARDGLPQVRLKPAPYAGPDVALRVFRLAQRSGALADWPDGPLVTIVAGSPTSELSPASRAALLSAAPPAPPGWWRP